MVRLRCSDDINTIGEDAIVESLTFMDMCLLYQIRSRSIPVTTYPYGLSIKYLEYCLNGYTDAE